MRILVVLVLLAGCHSPEKKWKQGRTYGMFSGTGFEGDIPKGWRDTRDLEGQDGFGNVGALLWPESFADGEILVGAIAPVSGDGCAGFVVGFNSVDTTKMSVANATPATFGGDAGCWMSFAKDGKRGWLLIRTHHDHAVFARCLGTMSGLVQACEDVITAFGPVDH